MKNSDIVSAGVGAAFFAVPFVILSVPIVPSLVIGTSAFVAGELLFNENEKKVKKNRIVSVKKIIEAAKKQNFHIKSMKRNIEDVKVREIIDKISKTVDKIIEAVEENNKKARKINNFFEYYLPISVKLIDRYDLIENKRLSSEESKKIFTNTYKTLCDIDKAFNKMLDSLYQSEIVDIDADMKVFESMLKSDGLDEKEIEVKKEEV